MERVRSKSYGDSSSSTSSDENDDSSRSSSGSRASSAHSDCEKPNGSRSATKPRSASYEPPMKKAGGKWRFMQHKGPCLVQSYQALPIEVNFVYNGKPMKLSKSAEEAAGFYAQLLERDLTKDAVFNENFLDSWRETMTTKERKAITDMSQCDFSEMNAYYKKRSDERKKLPQDQKQKAKNARTNIQKQFGVCVLDGREEKVGNFTIEPPGIFIGRGNHPLRGTLKKRIQPEDIIINCSSNSNIPQPPNGHEWKKVIHDNSVCWLASWTDPVQGKPKYMALDATSGLKGDKDRRKFDKARELANNIQKIRKRYTADLKSSDLKVRQLAVALHLIDILALRAGNEKGDEESDTFGCCTLRCEHVELHAKKEMVTFDFIGKDSIRFLKTMQVEKSVIEKLRQFMKHKKEGDDLFDRINTTSLNKYVNSIVKGMSAKVFRTYKASQTLEQQLDQLTKKTGNVKEKIQAYKSANRAVAILLNHRKSTAKPAKSQQKKPEEEVSLNTSKLNYCDPRITIAWCNKFDVPVERIYNNRQREKFAWALSTKDFTFDRNRVSGPEHAAAAAIIKKTPLRSKKKGPRYD